MKKYKKLKQSFGINEYGLIDFPKKISGIQISRLLYGDEMGCSYCFPHGPETVNSNQKKYQRNWKKYRKIRWRDNRAGAVKQNCFGGQHIGSNPILETDGITDHCCRKFLFD